MNDELFVYFQYFQTSMSMLGTIDHVHSNRKGQNFTPVAAISDLARLAFSFQQGIAE